MARLPSSPASAHLNLRPESQIAFWRRTASVAGKLRPRRIAVEPWPDRSTEPGISVVIPSRNGKDLLAAQMAGVVRELEGIPSEILVVDNGSSDGTAAWLSTEWPRIQVQVSPIPLSFARAVNRGIAKARFSRICLLNNDMILEPGFFTALARAFDEVPDLFCATAQILFPEGVRREETGKAVYFQPSPGDFPIRCDEPLAGEDLTWVLYGSGGCSLYDAAKLRVLGSIDPAFDPVYVEDLDIGYRAWQQGWPTVYVAGAVLEHRHRATSSRYYTEQQLDRILEVNYLRFLARAVDDREVFLRLWEQALGWLEARESLYGLRSAARIAMAGGPKGGAKFPDELILGLGSGAVAVFPGQCPQAEPRTLVAGADLHGEIQAGTLVVAFTDRLARPSAQALAQCREVVVVRRSGGDEAFRGALRQTVHKWRPAIARLLGEGMGQFAAECAPARVVT